MRRVLTVALLLSMAARAEEPTPFWLPPPPPPKQQAPVKKPKPVKKKPVQAEPLPIRPKEKALISAPQPTAVELAPPALRPTPSGPAATAAPAVPIPEQPAAVVLAEPASELQADEVRRWSIDLAFGAWGKARSDGGGRDWQLAYGLRFGRALLPELELEVELLRAGGSAGSPFVSASATHNLVALRVFWVAGDRLALLLGGGAGAALAQTHYTLLPSTDPGLVATGLDAVALKSVMEIAAVVRARIFRRLEARAEVSAAARDGKLELVPLLGAGAAF